MKKILLGLGSIAAVVAPVVAVVSCGKGEGEVPEANKRLANVVDASTLEKIQALETEITAGTNERIKALGDSDTIDVKISGSISGLSTERLFTISNAGRFHIDESHPTVVVVSKLQIPSLLAFLKEKYQENMKGIVEADPIDITDESKARSQKEVFDDGAVHTLGHSTGKIFFKIAGTISGLTNNEYKHLTTEVFTPSITETTVSLEKSLAKEFLVFIVNSYKIAHKGFKQETPIDATTDSKVRTLISEFERNANYAMKYTTEKIFIKVSGGETTTAGVAKFTPSKTVLVKGLDHSSALDFLKEVIAGYQDTHLGFEELKPIDGTTKVKVAKLLAKSKKHGIYAVEHSTKSIFIKFQGTFTDLVNGNKYTNIDSQKFTITATGTPKVVSVTPLYLRTLLQLVSEVYAAKDLSQAAIHSNPIKPVLSHSDLMKELKEHSYKVFPMDDSTKTNIDYDEINKFVKSTTGFLSKHFITYTNLRMYTDAHNLKIMIIVSGGEKYIYFDRGTTIVLDHSSISNDVHEMTAADIAVTQNIQLYMSKSAWKKKIALYGKIVMHTIPSTSSAGHTGSHTGPHIGGIHIPSGLSHLHHHNALPSALWIKGELKSHNMKIITPAIAKELDKLTTQSGLENDKQITFTKLQTFVQSHGITIRIVKANHHRTYIYFETTLIKYRSGSRVGHFTPRTLKNTDIPSGKNIVFLGGLLGTSIIGEIK